MAISTACSPQPGGRLRRFEQTLAAHDSATAALREWCAAEGIADPSRIIAQPVSGTVAPEPPGLREALAIGPDEPVGYRHVRLVCGDTILSEAHNWYVPARLAPEMNAALTGTDTPFGAIAAPLHFRRERLAASRGEADGCPAGTVLFHRALLRLPDGLPLALLVECYTAANLGPAVR